MNRILIFLFFVCTSGIMYGQTYTVNGKLGIGTEPVEKLQVQGNMKVDGSSFLLGPTLITGELELASTLKLQPPALNPEKTSLLMVNADGTVTRMLITDLLHAVYAEPCKGEFGILASPVWTHSPGKIFVHGGACNFDPFVGIGTSNPEYKFDVAGDSRLRGSSRFGLGAIDTDAQVEIFPANSKEYGLKLHSSPSAIGMYMLTEGSNNRSILLRNSLTNQDVFRVNGNGKVWATEVNVRIAGLFPDYVFDPEYKLMPLLKLEEYLKTNKHLPNFPSAEDVEKNGVDLGSMNTMLVEKVEELTLYIIELNKRITELESK